MASHTERDANGFPFLTVALFRATPLPVPLPPRQVQGEHGGVAAAGPLALSHQPATYFAHVLRLGLESEGGAGLVGGGHGRTAVWRRKRCGRGCELGRRRCAFVRCEPVLWVQATGVGSAQQHPSQFPGCTATETPPRLKLLSAKQI